MHLLTVKVDGDTTQHMKMSHVQVPILFFVTTNSLVALPGFDSIDAPFSCREELVPRTTHLSCLLCNRHFEHAAKFLANRMVIGASGEAIINKMSAQTKKEI